MRLPVLLVLAASVLALKQTPFYSDQQPDRQSDSLSSWATAQRDKSLQSILSNIGASVGAGAGIVIASPSRSMPDYFYHWVRDGAITMKALVSEYARTKNETIRAIIDDYVASIAGMQSGDLGEPKFESDGSVFTGEWGRPQRDGPALRALTLMAYAETQPSRARSLYALIKPDLEYVARTWASPGFDLWEEVEGLHFFTAVVQHSALDRGSALAYKLGDVGAAEWYRRHARSLSRFLLAFYDDDRGRLVETLGSARSGLDAALLLAAIHSDYPVHSDYVVASLSAFVSEMRGLYPLNVKAQGVAVGRYVEDIYDGTGTSVGNPWFICTASVAHALYALVDHLARSPAPLHVTNITLPFYSQFLPSRALTLEHGSSERETVMRRIMQYADSFLDVVRIHASHDGELSEQFDRVTGFMRGASQLTWSHEAVLSAIDVRARAERRLKGDRTGRKSGVGQAF